MPSDAIVLRTFPSPSSGQCAGSDTPQKKRIKIRAEVMSAGQQYTAPSHSRYEPATPDTFYEQVKVQPPTTNSASDSANTPPSPVSKSRRTVARASQSQSAHSNNRSTLDSIEFSSSFRGPSIQVRKERERQLANTPREALIQLAIKREYEAKKAKQLLTTAVLQLEVVKEHLAREEEARKALEQEKHMHGVKTTQAVLKAQMDTMNIQQEIGTYKLQVENLQRDLQRAKEMSRSVEEERDEAERALVRARMNAREMKEKNVLLLAREEGRREGFDEGLRQGRLALAAAEPPLITNGTATSAEGSTSKGRKEPRRARKPGRTTPAPVTPTAASLEAEAAQAKLREIDEQEKLRTKMQLLNAEKLLDKQIQRSKDAELAAKQLIEERRRIEQDRRRIEEERDRERKARKEAEREKEEVKRREEETRRLEYQRQQLYVARERELIELKREKERLEREKADAVNLARKEIELERERTRRLEEERERDRERERERDEREREREKDKEHETAATIAAATAAAITAAVGAAKSSESRHGSTVAGSPPPPEEKLPYFPMPAPPIMPGSGMPGVPRATSSSSYRGGRRMSFGSASSSMASGLPLDMLQFPNDRDMRGDLSVILEDTSMRASTPGRPSSRASTIHPFPPVSMPKAPGDSGYVPPGEVPAAYPPGPVTMPRAPGEAPATYQPPVTMPQAPGDGPGPGYQPPPSMPRAPGEGPAYYPPTGVSATPGSTGYNSAPIEMPRAPGEEPATYIPPAPGANVTAYSSVPFEMPRAPGEAPSAYRPPVPGTVGSGGPGYASAPTEMPRAPGEAPATYKPPVAGSVAGYNSGPIEMPRAPGEAPTTYKPPASGTTETPGLGSVPVAMPLAPGEAPTTYQPPAGTSRATSSPYQPPTEMPRVPGEALPYRPPTRVPRTPTDGHGTPYQPAISMPRAPGDGPVYIPPPDAARTPGGSRGFESSMTMPRAPADGPMYVPPPVMPRAPSVMSNRNAGGYTPNNNLLTPHGANRNGPMRRPSNGSNSSYEILVEPPSRPPSSLVGDHDQNVNSYLSPNLRSVNLPQVPAPQIQPTRPRGILRTSSETTQPNSPAEAPYALPPNFIPQTLTDRHGVSTPISHTPVLPGMGPVIPGPPVIPRPPSSQGGPYGNPLANKGKERASSAASNNSPFIPPAVLGSAGPGSPNIGGGTGWGSRAGSRAGSIGGATPKASFGELPGPRTGVPLYGPPSPRVKSAIPPSVFGDYEIASESDGFDQTTLNNTLLNTSVPAIPTVISKKKKKGRK